MVEDVRQRAQDKIAQLAGRGGDLVTFWQESSEVIAHALPYYFSPCWYTLDPASLLMTSHFQQGLPEFPREWLEAEYLSDDVNKLVDVARSDRGVSTLHEATGGDPSSSPRWQANMEYGGDQEMIAGLRTRSGEVWGAVGLYREPGEPMFDADDVRFVQAVSPYLAEGARRALLVGEATEPETPDGPGLVVLSADYKVESTTPGSSGGWPSCRTGTGTRVACRPPCSPLPPAPAGPPRRPTSPGRLRSSGCSPAPVPGWCCTVPRWSPTARAGWR